MAIFQPSFVTPDRRNGLGNGTIDATQNLTVSWRINGPSALQYFSISIYSNDAASTELYTTGKISDGCPFYGTTNTGEIQFFSYTIPAATLSSNGITNGNEYKLIIQQWWNANDSVVQSSASAFFARTMPTVSTEGILYLTTLSHTFQGTYTQAQGDSLNWFRWQIERVVVDGDNVTVFDSGEISGTGDVSCTFNGFIVYVPYRYKLTVQTENGVTADSGWSDITVNYATITKAGYVKAECQSNTSAVKIDFSGLTAIPGEATGTYTINNSLVSLDPGASITWDTVNESAMNFWTDWYAVATVQLTGANYDSCSAVFTIGQDAGDIKIEVYRSYPFIGMNIWQGETAIFGDSKMTNASVAYVLVTSSYVIVRLPGVPVTFRYEFSESTYGQQNVDYVKIEASNQGYSPKPVKFGCVEVYQGNPSQEFLDMFNSSYQERTAPFYMSASFSDSIGGGAVDVNTLTGYSVYRELREEVNTQLVPVCHTGLNNRVVYEYGAKSQKSYKYYVFPESDTQIIMNGIGSNTVTPCWWDWSLMECQVTGDKNSFTVLAEYRFGSNVSTSTMSNNNTPNVLQNFTPYPTVQLAPQNYKSGTLTALIGVVENATYSDSISLMDKLYALPLSSNPFFLKDRKGRLMRVRISGEITMQTGDNNLEQPQTISLPWVEVGSAEGVGLWALNNMSQGV